MKSSTSSVWTVVASSALLSAVTWPRELRGRWVADAPQWARDLLAARIGRSERDLAGNPDAWEGYPAAPGRMLDVLSARAGHTLVMSGDTHSSWAFRLECPDGRPLGYELGIPAVTSEASLQYVNMPRDVLQTLSASRNSELEYLDAGSRGYTVIELGRDGAAAEWRYVADVQSARGLWRVGHTLEL